eukprot:TRINITY_DN114801_c0_g1_i1.p1 TRINITY_DN114801_c0_g1~~TRINITY_DN114801_c0_g1_i1.p1  ORF type:complete len:422 (-),score=84.58 TRINITY_DN114801_c0_g1_i1:143-1408(-)
MAEAESCDEDQSDVSDDEGAGLLGATLTGDALAKTLVDAQTAIDMGLLRSEVKRLRRKVQSLDREKDDMVDNFRNTTKILLERIKELEAEVSQQQSRPQTAAVIDRIEARGQASKKAGHSHQPEVMRIEEEPSQEEAAEEEGGEEVQACGNCGRLIPAGNLVSHSVYCYRNNYRCTACDEVIAIRDKESHLEEWTNPTRLLEATKQHDVQTVQSMVAHGADLATAVHPGSRDTVLHEAARIGDADLIGFFMGYGVDVDPLNVQGETPLHLAAEAADFSSVRLLVELGADLNISNGRGESPLMLVCRKGAAKAAKFLLEMKADAEAQTKLGDTPLQIAQRLGFQDTVLALCQAGAPLRPGTPNRGRSGSPIPGHSPSPPPSILPSSSPRPGSGGANASAGYPPLPPRRDGRPPQPTAPHRRP